jgi:pilus assembly protein CpaF
VTMQEIFVFEKMGLTEEGRVKGSFRATGIRPKCAQMIAASGIQLPRQMFEHLQVVA